MNSNRIITVQKKLSRKDFRKKIPSFESKNPFVKHFAWIFARYWNGANSNTVYFNQIAVLNFVLYHQELWDIITTVSNSK